MTNASEAKPSSPDSRIKIYKTPLLGFVEKIAGLWNVELEFEGLDDILKTESLNPKRLHLRQFGRRETDEYTLIFGLFSVFFSRVSNESTRKSGDCTNPR